MIGVVGENDLPPRLDDAFERFLRAHRRPCSQPQCARLAASRRCAYGPRSNAGFMADSLLVPVVYGSVRSERQGIKAARFLVTALRERGCTPVLVDPLEQRLPLLDRMYK